MSQELKITIGDSPTKTIISIGDRVIGCIQDIKVHVGVDQIVPEVEIVFPDVILRAREYGGMSNSLAKSHQEALSLLADLPWVKVSYKLTAFIDEVGTDGHIDHIPGPT